MTTDAVDLERIAAQERTILEATEQITALLEAQGLTRKALADQLGKTKGFVSHLLSGERNMTLRTLSDLAFVLGHTVEINVRECPTAVHAGGTRSTPGRVFVGHTGRERAAPAPRAQADVVRREDLMAQPRGYPDSDGGPNSHECALAA